MKEKWRHIIEDEKKKTLLILILVTIILSVFLVTIILIVTNKKENKVSTTTKTTLSTKVKDIFKGFNSTEYNYDINSPSITYDLKSKHEFIYANGEDKKTIYTNYKGKELYYELNLDNGKILFKEARYNNNLSAYEFTGLNYSFEATTNITDYLVVATCEKDQYSIIAKDSKANIYVFNSPNEEFGIDYIINNIKSIKVISKVSKVGYYNYNNYPHRECNEYDLVYLDTLGNVRYIVGKNALFFEDAYYRFIGDTSKENFIYDLKNGLMQYDTGETKNLNDGNYNINYMGSFYTLNNDIEDLYIICTKGYVYKIANFNFDSSVILKKVNNTRIKKIGTRVVKDSNDYATDKHTVKIEFEDNEVLELASVNEFELLK